MKWLVSILLAIFGVSICGIGVVFIEGSGSGVMPYPDAPWPKRASEQFYDAVGGWVLVGGLIVFLCGAIGLCSSFLMDLKRGLGLGRRSRSAGPDRVDEIGGTD